MSQDMEIIKMNREQLEMQIKLANLPHLLCINDYFLADNKTPIIIPPQFFGLEFEVQWQESSGYGLFTWIIFHFEEGIIL